MSVTAINAGLRSDNINQAGLVIDMEAQAAELEQDSYPFEAITRNLRGGVQNATRMEHKFREHRLMPNNVTVLANAAANATSISVSNPEYFHRDQLIFNPVAQEVFVMDEDIGGTAVAGAIKVRKSTAATGTGIVNAIAAGTYLVNMGESHAEGEDIPPAFSTQEVEVSTYIMQMDRTIEVTDIQNAEEHYGQKQRDLLRKRQWIEEKRDLSFKLYASRQFRETASTGGARRHGMRGLIEYLEATEQDMSGLPAGLTLRTIAGLMEPTTRHSSSSSEKIIMAGTNAWTYISSFGDGTERIKPGKDQAWGVTINKLMTAFGQAMVVYDQNLSQRHGLADRMFILDPAWIYQIQMNTLPLVMKLNVENASEIHKMKDVITGTRGLVLKLAELHSSVRGIN